MKKGNTRRYFAGGNTCMGFYSRFEELLAESKNRVYYIKGTPGGGKSTFIKKIGKALTEKGMNVEYLHCSSDGDSLDGVIIPEMGKAVVDGTAPHMMDPKFAGAVDETLDLGIFLDKKLVAYNKEKIIRARKHTKRMFDKAFFNLKVAKLFSDEIDSCLGYSGALNEAGLNNYIQSITNNIFPKKAKENKTPRQRRVFATAITPTGPMSFLNDLFSTVERRVVVKSSWKPIQRKMVKKIEEQAKILGINTEVYYCGFNPLDIEHLILKDINTGIITENAYHKFNNLEDKTDIILEPDKFVSKEKISSYEEEIKENKNKFSNYLNKGISYLTKAKATHGEVEEMYVPSMDFKSVDKKWEIILDEIINH